MRSFFILQKLRDEIVCKKQKCCQCSQIWKVSSRNFEATSAVFYLQQNIKDATNPPLNRSGWKKVPGLRNGSVIVLRAVNFTSPKTIMIWSMPLAWLRAQAAGSAPFRAALHEIWTLALGLSIAAVSIVAMRAVMASSPSARAVDRESCTCSCWDGAFKNGYSTAGYRTVFFSLDERLIAVALWPAAYFLLALALARAAATTLAAGEARLPFAAVLLAQVYPHHYSFWTGWNYLNESNSGFMIVQVTFAVSEVVATAAIAAQLSSRTPLSPRALWLVVGIAALHMWHSALDWTSDKWGVPIMFAADAVSVAVAGAFIASLVGKRIDNWFVPVAADYSAAMSTGASTSGTVTTASKAAGDLAAPSVRAAPRPVYTRGAAVVDGLITVAAVTICGIALKSLQETARTW